MDTEKKKILLVEDEIIIAMLEKKQLENIGYSICHVINGEYAVQQALSKGVNYDLILMDIDLGSGIDGTQAAEEILKEKDIPVVFLSSHTKPEIVEKTEKITSYGYVVKNSGIVVLDASIKMALKLFEAKLLKKQTEDTLRMSEKKYSITFHLNPNPMAITDLASGIIIDVNKAFTNWSGYSTKDVIGVSTKNLKLWINAEDRNRMIHLLNESGVLNEEKFTIKQKNGEYRTALFSARIFHFNDKPFILSLAQDITERNRTEEQLHQLSSIVEQADEMIILTDSEFKITYMNHAAEKITGYTLAEVKGEKPSLFSSNPNDDTRHDRFFSLLQEGFNNKQEYINRHKYGKEYITQATISPIRNADRKITGYVSFQRDITEEKQAETTFRESVERLNSAQKATHVGNWEYNIVTNNFLGSDEAKRIYGFDPNQSDFSSDEVYKCIPERERIEKAMVDLIQEGKEYNLEFKIHPRNSHVPKIIWSIAELKKDENGNPLIVTGVIQDITERIRIEEALRESETKYRQMIENTHDIIYIMTPEGVLVYVSQSWTRLLGHPVADIEGHSFIEFVHPDDLPPCYEFLHQVVKKGLRQEGVEYRVRHFNGDWLWHTSSASPIMNNEGVITGFYGIARDITKRRQAEEEIKRQLSEKEILLKEVHHRIKNNIASIEGLLSLQAASTHNVEVKAALNESISRIQSIRVLYEKLMISNNYQDVSIKNYIDSLIDSLVEVFPDSINVSIERNIKDFTLSSKKAIPVGILINELMTNVFKYAFNNKDRKNVIIEIMKSENQVTLIIKDNGIGINDKIDGNKSPGFGLTIVRMLAEQLKGTFTMENDNGTKSVLKFLV